MFSLKAKNTFITELPSDPVLENHRRQVEKACFSYVEPKKTAAPLLLHVSDEMLNEVGISKEDSNTEDFLMYMTGNKVYPNTHPYAMCYGGHQFGQWAGQLGDGRAINLFEVSHNQQDWVIQLKGAGETPYSRRADGLAVLRSSIREYLCSEAMHHLGVPTTRALSLALTGDEVLRDIMYNGNPAYEKGAIVSRVAPSFLRFGSYEIFASHNDTTTLKTLVDYTINQFYSHLGQPSKESYLAFFKEVSELTLDMIMHWQRVGFVHGVMNTDNMSILGLTIDYGPYGWLEEYDPTWTPNTTDSQNRRYRFGNQPNIGLWNLLKLANAIYPLIEEASGLEAILNDYKVDFDRKELAMKRSKLGFESELETDALLLSDLDELLGETQIDYIMFYRILGNFKKEGEVSMDWLKNCSYDATLIEETVEEKWKEWFKRYQLRLQGEGISDTERKRQMNKVNPKYVLRNYMAQLAIEAADQGDYRLIDELYLLLKKPYDEQPEHEQWFAKRPKWADDKIGCSMLSCSS